MNEMSSGESKEKLSKKARLKLARERAAKFGERDKAKIESQTTKKSSIAVPKTVAQRHSPNHNVEQKTTETTARTATKSPNEKMPLAERRKIAKQNAKQFAARDKVALKWKKKEQKESKISKIPPSDPSPMDVVEEANTPSNAVHPSNISSNQQNFGVAIDPNQVAEYERMRQMHYTMKQQQEMRQQTTFAAGHFKTGVASPREQSATSQMSDVPARGNDEINVHFGRNEDDKNFGEEIDEEDIMPPPPPALMAQVSQQVLLNARNEDEDSVNQVSIEDEKQNELEKEQEMTTGNNTITNSPHIDRNDQQLRKTNLNTRWFPNITSKVIIGIAISSIILMLPMPPGDNLPKLPAGDDTVIEIEPFCYYNSQPDSEDYCLNATNGMECPKAAVCKGGKIVACDNPFQDISDQGNKCVLDEKYLPIKDALTNELVRLASQLCDQSTKPSFKYNLLQKNNSTIPEIESEELVEALMDEGFVMYDRDGLFVGLPEEIKVSLPMYCHVGNMGQLIIQEVGLLLLGVLKFALSNLLGFVLTYPELSFLNLIVLMCFFWYRRHLAGKKKRETDTKRTRELAYKTLEETCGVEHCAIHIRDEIAMALYPNSKKDRLQLQKSIWPKIVDDVKRDTRVRKFQHFTRDGKTRDMWQWTAASKTPSKA